MPSDLKCDFCGRETDGSWIGFTCRYCHGYFCPDHRLPESHGCVVRMPTRTSSDRPPLTVTASYKTRGEWHGPRRSFRRRPGRRALLSFLAIAWIALPFVYSLVPSVPDPLWYVVDLMGAALALLILRSVYWYVDRNAGNAGRTFLVNAVLLVAAFLMMLMATASMLSGFQVAMELPAAANLAQAYSTNLVIFFGILFFGLMVTGAYAAYRLRHRYWIN